MNNNHNGRQTTHDGVRRRPNTYDVTQTRPPTPKHVHQRPDTSANTQDAYIDMSGSWEMGACSLRV
ncbi:hypothetical protein BYT27DRAFT_7183325, partial [Phlegmacium glaucopus]